MFKNHKNKARLSGSIRKRQGKRTSLEFGRLEPRQLMAAVMASPTILNGQTSGVVQLAAQAGCSVEEYVNKLIEQASSDLESIREGLKDVEAGRMTPLREFDQEFRKEKGFSPKADA